MKILQVSAGFPPQKSTGAEKLCYELSRRLIEKGIQVEIVTRTTSTRFDDLKLHDIFKIDNKYLRKLFFDYYNPVNGYKIEKVLKSFQPNIVHFHNVYGLSTQLINCVSRKIPTVLTVHDYWPFCYWTTMLRNGKFCHRRCNRCKFPLTYLHKKIHYSHLKNSFLVAPSRHMESQLRKVGNFKYVTPVYNGIDVRERKTSYTKSILFVGRLTLEKGLPTVISVLDCIAKTTKWQVNVLGDGVLKRGLKKKYKYVKFRGFTNPEKYYLNNSILVVPSIWPENLPYSVLEAMSYGLTVVGSNVGGIPELIHHQRTGFLFEPGDKDDFREQIYYLIKNFGEIKRIGKNAREKVKSKFNLHSTVTNYLDLYSKILNPSKEALKKV